MLCDDVRVEADTNKQVIIGVFDRVTKRDFSTPLPPFTITCKVLLDDWESHRIGFTLIPPTGAPSIIMTGDVRLTAGPHPVYDQPSFNANIKVGNLIVPGPGRYAIDITVDDVIIWRLEFVVRQKEGEET